MFRKTIVMTISMICLAVAQADTCGEGVDAHDARNYNAAVAAFTLCIDQADEPSPELLQKRGRANMKAGALDAALLDFTAAIEADENYAPSYNSRAWVHYLQGNLPAASNDIETAFGLDPNNSRILDTKAHILAAMGDTAAAVTVFEQAMQGQSKENVAKIQDELRSAGYDPGPADGVYGRQTRAALAACAAAACNIWENRP